MQTEIRKEEDGSISAVRFIAEDETDKAALVNVLTDFQDYAVHKIPEPSVPDPTVSPSAATGETSVGSASQQETEG